MVTLVGITSEGLGVYRGLSTDLPLSPAPKNGTRFFAMDNGKTYWYDADNSQWLGYSSGGGGGGASDLNDLTDVNITGTPQAGQVLAYNGTKWVNTGGYVTEGEMISYCELTLLGGVD